MKKILLFLFLAMPLMGFAQKSYMTLSTNYGYTATSIPILTGDVTDDLSEYLNLTKEYDGYGKNRWTGPSCYLGEILNKLSEKGYEIEFVNGVNYILSKRKEGSGSSSSSKIQNVKIEDEGEPYEVARYNLQGIPVKANEKGVQIIVFSNYTTKTVVVE